jgi:hypothetical protein
VYADRLAGRRILQRNNCRIIAGKRDALDACRYRSRATERIGRRSIRAETELDALVKDTADVVGRNGGSGARSDCYIVCHVTLPSLE